MSKFFKKIKSTNIYNFLINAFSLLFIIYPCVTIFNSKAVEITFGIVLIILILILLNWKKINLLKSNKTIWVIIALSFLARLCYIFFINNNITQISDFMRVYDTASSQSFVENSFYYQTAYHYFYYTFINSILYKIFGAHQIVTLLLNTIILSLVPYFLYKICQKIFKDNIIGNIAAILYCMWPSMILYTAIFSPDHLALLFICISIYLLIIVLDKINDIKIKKDLLYIILAGFNVALIGFFKNFAPVLLIALFIILALGCLIKKYKLSKSIIVFIGVASTYFLTSLLMFGFIEHTIDAKVMKNQLGQYLYVGLGYENKGLYSQERYGEYQNYLITHNMNYFKTNKYFIRKLINEINDNYASMPSFIISKMNYSFENDSAQIWWVVSSFDDNIKSLSPFINDIIVPMNDGFYKILMFFCFIACIYNCVFEKKQKILLINLTIYGCSLLLLFAESQGRYKYAFEPLICIMAAIGIYYGYDLFKKILKKRKEYDL